MKIAVVADGDHVAQWQRDAITQMGGTESIVFLIRQWDRTWRWQANQLLFRLLTGVTRGSGLTKMVPITAPEQNMVRLRMENTERADQGGLDPGTTLALKEIAPDVAVWFASDGPPTGAQVIAPCPILTFRFGDPFPVSTDVVGFYEMLRSSPVVVLRIERISNGQVEVVADAETKVHPHSYCETRNEAFKHAGMLLRQALGALHSEPKRVALAREEVQPRPSNPTVVRFLVRMARAAFARLRYGAFVQKEWKVSRTDSKTVVGPVDSNALRRLEREQWETVDISPPYVFLADPFFRSDGQTLLVEALNGSTGKGEVVEIGATGTHTVSDRGNHFSYPAVVEQDGIEYIVPETAQWSEPTIYRLVDGRLDPVGPLKMPTPTRVVDGTFHWHDGRLYLFGCDGIVGGSALYLWHSDSLFGEFEPHPANPIRVSPRGSRMAGGLQAVDGRLLRFGQDGSGAYGNGVCLFNVNEISPSAYREEMTGSFRFDHRKGPHTLNFGQDRVVFDWYRERFSLLAGVRRFKGRA